MTISHMNDVKKRSLQLPDLVIEKDGVPRTDGVYKQVESDFVIKDTDCALTDDKMYDTVPANDPEQPEERPKVKRERWWQILTQVGIPFLIAGFGTIGAGVILGRVEQWDVFEAIPQLFILVPALMGLKGNLDMTMASRLSTQANLGNMDIRSELIHMVVGNISLVQVQATVAAFLISMFAIGVGAAVSGDFRIDHSLLITSAAMFTATTSCFVLNFVLVAVIVLANKFKVNPDNLATPLAASIGDIVAVSLLSLSVVFLYAMIETKLWVTYIVLSVYFLMLPCWVFVVLKNRYTRPVLKSGWIPVISALLISGLGGVVLAGAIDQFNGFVVFKPIIAGVGGNLVVVQASRMSTALHKSAQPGIVPEGVRIVEWPWKALFYGTPYSKASLVFILMSIPGSILFIFVADFIHMQASTIGVPFVTAYLTASLIQLMLLLYIAHVMTHGLWRFKVDPDNAAIPFLTAFGDLFGSSLLLAAFVVLRALGHEYDPDNEFSVNFGRNF